MAQGFGHAAWIGLGRESTWGTRVAPTVFARILEEGMKLNQSRVGVPTLGYTSMVRQFSSRRFVDGSIKLNPGFNGILPLLIGDVLGASSVSSAQQGATSAYLHTITPKDAMPVGLSMQCSRDAANIGTAYDYAGLMVESLTLRQANEGLLELEATFQGQDESKETEASESFPTFVGIDYTLLTAMTLNGVTQNLREFEITIANTLATDRGNLGARTRNGLGRGSGPREITGSMVIEFDAVTEYDLFRDLTEVPIVLTYNGGTDSIESGQDYTMTITMSQCRLMGPPEIGAKDHGPLLLPIEFQAFATASGNDEISVAIKNTDTSII